MGNNEMEELNKMLQITCSKISKRKAIEDTPEVMELRRLRDEHNEKAQEYQKQIDETIKAIHNVPDLNGKYIHYLSTRSDYEHFGKVKSVDRLFDGIRIIFSSELYIFTYDFGSDIHFSNTEGTMDVEWEDISDIEVITREEMIKVLDTYVSDFRETL